MARDLAQLGYEPLVAVTELDVVCHLQNREAQLHAVVAELSLDAPLSFGLLEFMKDGFPAVCRIAVARGSREKELSRAVVLVHADHAIDCPWTRPMLIGALGPQ